MTDCDSGGEEDSGPWVIGYRSDSSDLDDDVDVEADDERGHPKVMSRSLGRDFALVRDLDLSLRDDKAVFRQTPFTLAQAAKRDSLTLASTSIKKRERSSRPASPPRGSLAAVRAREADKKKSSKESGGGSEAWRNPNKKPNTVPWWRKKRTVWRNSNGQPVSPSDDDEEDQAPAPKLQKRSILDITDEAAEKKVAKKRKVASTQKGKTDEDTIVFQRIPKNARANDDFPLLQGFERQKSLPTKAKTKKKKSGTNKLIHDNLAEVDPLELNQLITGNNSASPSQPPRKMQAFPSARAQRLFDYALDPTRSKYFESANHVRGKSVPFKQSSESSPRLPALGHSGPTDPSQNLETPRHSQVETPRVACESDLTQPSTMTRISSGWDKNHSSSTPPYSSPLNRQDSRLAHPKPKRMADMTAMTARASRAKLEELVDPANDTGYEELQESPLSRSSHFKQPITSNPYDLSDVEDGWSTLPYGHGQPRRKRNSSCKTVYPIKTSAKFSIPTSLTQHSRRFSAQPTSSPSSHLPSSSGLKLTLFQPSPPKADPGGSQQAYSEQEESSPFTFRNRYAREIEQEAQDGLEQADMRPSASQQVFGNWQDKWGTQANRSGRTSGHHEQAIDEVLPTMNRFSRFASAHAPLRSTATGRGIAFGGY